MGTAIRGTPTRTRPEVPVPEHTDDEWLYAAGQWNALQDRLVSLDKQRGYIGSLFAQPTGSMAMDVSREFSRSSRASKLAELDAEEQRIRDEMRAIATEFPGIYLYAQRQTEDYFKDLERDVEARVARGEMTKEEGQRQLTELYGERQRVGSTLASGAQAVYAPPAVEEAPPAVTDITDVYGFDPYATSPYEEWQMRFAEEARDYERQIAERDYRQQLEEWAWKQRQAEQQYQLSRQQMGASMMPSLLNLQQQAWNARQQYELPTGTQYLPTFEPGGLMASLAQGGGWEFTPRGPLTLPIPGQSIGPAMGWAQGMMGY